MIGSPLLRAQGTSTGLKSATVRAIGRAPQLARGLPLHVHDRRVPGTLFLRSLRPSPKKRAACAFVEARARRRASALWATWRSGSMSAASSTTHARPKFSPRSVCCSRACWGRSSAPSARALQARNCELPRTVFVEVAAWALSDAASCSGAAAEPARRNGARPAPLHP